jgi:DNA-binding response OmpR family regulator
MPEGRVAVIIEDDLDFRGLISAILGAEGFIVHCEATGVAVVAAARKHDPDLIVLDFGLPDMDGVGVAKRLREFSGAHPGAHGAAGRGGLDAQRRR